nr:MAG: polyprotein [Wufeng shrew picorna-like virus 32]
MTSQRNLTSSVASEGNIAFCESKGVLTSQARVAPIGSNLIAEGVKSAQAFSQVDLAERWVNMGSVAWNTTDTYTNLASYTLYTVMGTKPSYISQLIAMYSYYRMDLRVRVQINSTKFHQGRLAIAFLPYSTQKRVKMGDVDFVNFMSGLPHVMLDAASSNVAELNIPWTHWMSQMRTTYGSQSGIVVLSVLSPLLQADNASKTLDLAVWFSFTNIQLNVPRAIVSKPFAERAEAQMDIALEGAVAAIASPIKAAMEPIMQIIKPFADNSLSRPSEINLRSSVNLSASAGPVMFDRLSLNPTANLENTIGGVYTQHDEMSLRYLCAIPQIIAVFDANVVNYIPIGPGASIPNVVAGGTPTTNAIVSYSTSYMGYYSSLFKFWRGGINVKVEFVTSMFATGRVACVFDPDGGTVWDDRLLLNPTVLMDLQEKRTFKFNIPYLNEMPFCDVKTDYWKIPDPSKSDAVAEFDQWSHSGTLIFKAVNDLVYPTGVAKECKMFVWFSAGQDFELACIRDVFSTYTLNTVVAEQAECQMMAEDVTARDEKLNDDYEPMFKVALPSGNFVDMMFNDGSMHLKQIIGRSTFVGSFRIPPDKTTKVVLNARPGIMRNYKHGQNTDLLSYCSAPFVFYRGSVRFTIVTDCSKIQRAVAFAVWEDQTTVVVDDYFSVSSGVRFLMPSGSSGLVAHNLSDTPILKLELPYFSPAEHVTVDKETTQPNSVLAIYFNNCNLSTTTTFNRSDIQAYVFKSAGDDMRLFFPVAPPAISAFFFTRNTVPSLRGKKENLGVVTSEDRELVWVEKEEAEVQMYMTPKGVLTGLCVMAIPLSVGYLAYTTRKWYYRARDALSGLGNFTTSFLQTLPALVEGSIPIKFGGLWKNTMFKCLISAYELMRIRSFVDFVLWFAHLLTDLPIFAVVTSEMLWRIWQSFDSARSEVAQAQSGSVIVDSDLTMGLIMVVGLLGLTGYGTLSTDSKRVRSIDLCVSRIKNLALALTSFSSLALAAPRLKTTVEDVLFTVFGVCNDRVASMDKLRTLQKEMVDWCERILVLNSVDNRNRLKYVQEMQDEVNSMRLKGIEYMTQLAGSDVSAGVMTAFREIYKKMEELSVIAMRSSANRGYKFEPFCVCLTGTPGVGKTYLSRFVAKALMHEDNLEGVNNVYCRSGEDPYWSNYAGQHTVIYDDFGKLDPTNAAYDIYGEFLAVRSGEVYAVNMADLPDKGTLFTSKCVILTTNDAYSKPRTLTEYKAWWRRRNFVWQVSSNVGPITLGNVSKVDRFEHLVFERKDVLNPGVPGELYSYDKMLEVVVDEYRRWKNAEMVKAQQMSVIWKEPAVAQSGDLLMAMRCQQLRVHGLQSYYPDWFLRAFIKMNGVYCVRDTEVETENKLLAHTLLDEIDKSPDLACMFDEFLENRNSEKTISVLRDTKFSFFSAIKNMWKKPVVQAATGLAISVALLWSAWRMFGTREEELEPQALDGEPSVSKRVKRIKPRVVTAYSQSGGHDDVAADRLIDNVLTHNIVVVIDKISGRRVQGLGLCERYVLMPFHFFFELSEDAILKVQTLHRQPVEMFFLRKFVRGGHEKQDWCVYELDKRMPLFRNIVSHFVSLEDLSSFSHLPAALCVLESEEVLSKVLTLCERVGTQGVSTCTYNVLDTPFEVVHGWRYNVSTMKGNCGAPLVAYNKYFTGKILGVHVAGVPGKKKGWATALTREDILKVVGSGKHTSMPVPEVEEAEPMFALDGDFTFIGKNRISNFVMPTSQLEKTCVYNLISESTKQPAILSKYDVRNVSQQSPLIKNLALFGESMPCFDMLVLEEVVTHTISVTLMGMRDASKLVKKRVYTIDEAIGGVHEHAWFKSIDRSTSMGYPWRFQGKKKNVVVDDNMCLVDEDIRNAISCRFNAACRGLALPCVWLDCLKDEKVAEKKILDVKTRTFSVCPFDFLIVMRQLFGAFFSAWIGACDQFYSTVGINPESCEWNALFYNLKCKGNSGFGFDYSGFDRKIDPNFVMWFVDMVNMWYNDSYSVARKVLMEQHIHRYSLVADLLYCVHWGQPSGGYLTTLLNSFVNACYVRYAYTITKIDKGFNKHVDDFELYFTDRNYGDDGLLVGTLEGLSVFSHLDFKNALADVNLVVTASDDKINDMVLLPLEDLTFLKRRFVALNGLIVPQLALSSILEMFNWKMKSVCDADHITQNVMVAGVYLSTYPFEIFNQYKSKIEQVCYEAGINVFMPSRNWYLDEYYFM